MKLSAEANAAGAKVVGRKLEEALQLLRTV